METSAGPGGARLIEPLFNEAFIRIFGREESKRMTRGLVNAALGAAGLEPIGEIEQIAAEHASPGGSVECKTPRFDVRVVSESRLVGLEAQLYPSRVADRAAYYAACSLVEATGKIADYRDLPQSVVITLLDGPALMPGERGWVHAARLAWDGGGTATDRIALVVVELAKVRERYNGLSEEVLADELTAWAYLLTRGYRDPEEVSAIVSGFPTIEEFAELYGLAVNDPKVVNAHRDAQSAELEYNARQEYLENLEREAIERGFERGEQQGFEQGERRGFERGERELADRLRALGVDEDVLRQALE